MNAAGDYAEKNYGIGILLHVGDDLRARAEAAAKQHGVEPQVALDFMLSKLDEHYTGLFKAHGVDAKMFPTTNLDAEATLISYHVDKLLYETQTGEADLGLVTAERAVPDVIEFLKTAKQFASLEAEPEPAAFRN